MIDAKMAHELKTWLMQLNISPNDCWENVECKVADIPYPKHFNFHISDGASKICFVFHDKDFVLKWSTEGEGEAMQEVYYYEEAKIANLAKFFPRTEHFFSHNGVDFVMQEKVTIQAGDVWGDMAVKYQKIAKTVPSRMVDKVQKDLNKVTDYTRHINTLWIACLLSLYGKKATKALCKFVQEHDINDLHGSNVGFKNDRPIILDFSGYHRQD